MTLRAISGDGTSPVAFFVRSNATVETTDDTSSSISSFRVLASKKSSACEQALGSTANLFNVGNHGTNSVFLVKGDGDVHTGGGDADHTALDAYDDLGLMLAVRDVILPENDPARLQTDFRAWAEKYEGVLEANRIVFPNHEHPCQPTMISMRGMYALTIDTFRQMYSQMQDQQEQLTALTGQLQSLQEGK